MEVHPGSRLGSYEVLDLLGEGGMGSVYRATDTRLHRQVALKIVRPPLAGDSDRIARLTREAQLLASLSHPHIATIHGIEESEGVLFLVLELVPGVTLAERIARGALPVPEALALAAQIAAALEAAHEHGVIHRDLKPANIKITPDGSVKVLDFGLAKSFAPDAGTATPFDSPTVTSAGTAAGTVLGTPAYMSPEQARGLAVDKRADIWAFGCVLYGMLTGRPAFGRDTVPDTIAAVLGGEPEWSLLPPDLPAPIHRVLRRSLAKDPQHRLRDIGDVRLEIEEALTPGAAGPSAGRAGAARGTPRDRLLLTGAVVGLAALAAVAAWMLKPSPAPAARAAVQLAVPLPPGEQLDGLGFPAVALSPMETHVAFVAARGGHRRLFVHTLATLESGPLPGTEGALGPFFSPDGEWIGFFADGMLKKVRVTGGPVRPICEAPIGFGAVWRPDGTIVFAPDNGAALWRVSAEGGPASAVTALDTRRGEFSHRWPEVAPDAGAVLFTVGTEGTWDDAEIDLQVLASGERRTVVEGGTSPRLLPDGRLLYGRGGSLFAVPFDPKAREATAATAPLLDDVLESSDGAMQVSVSPGGSVAFITGSAGSAERTLVWLDRQGNPQPLAAPERAYSSPRLSPDGRQLAVIITGADRDEVWVLDLARNALAQVTFSGGSSPVWSAEGTSLVFSASRGGPPNLFRKKADGSGGDERLTNSPRTHVPSSCSTDGRTVAFVETTPSAGDDILLLDTGSGAVRPFLATAADETAPMISPDGEWLAYVSDESGRGEVYIAPIDGPSRRVRVSADGGSEPVWRRDGAELFFRSGGRVLAAVVTARPALGARPARVLFEGAFDAGVASRPAYDVSPDGARFLMVAPSVRRRSPNELRVILGWAARPPTER